MKTAAIAFAALMVPAFAPVASAGNDTACADTTMTIYFAPDSTRLTPQADRVIADQAERLRECKVKSIFVEAHSGAGGTQIESFDMAADRTSATTVALEAAGFDTAQVRILPIGEREAVASDGDLKVMNRKAIVRFDVEETMPAYVGLGTG